MTPFLQRVCPSRYSAACICLVLFSAPGLADQLLTDADRIWLERREIPLWHLALDAPPATQSAPAATPTSAPASAETKEPAGPLDALSFSINYTLVTDYVFRGLNLSEPLHEHRDKMNHQMTTDLGIDLAAIAGLEPEMLGAFHFGTFFEWYAAQGMLNTPDHDELLQEIDYSIGWTYNIKPIETEFAFNYIFYTYPYFDEIDSTEVTLQLSHNDSWMWKWLFPELESGGLNPTILYAYDWDEGNRGSWFEFSIHHEFEIVKNVTIMPLLGLTIDDGYLDGTLDTQREGHNPQVAYVQYGITAAYDMSELMQIEKWGKGRVVLSGFLNYNQTTDRLRHEGLINDILWGGMTIGWSF